MRVNLLGEKKQKINTSVSWLRIGVVVLVFVVIGAALANMWFMRNRVNRLRDESSILDDQLAIYRPREQEYHELTAQIEELQDMEIEGITQHPWGESLLELGYLVPDRVLFTDININNDRMRIMGEADTDQDLISLLSGLEDIEIFYDVDLEEIDQQEDIYFSIGLQMETGG